MPYFSIQTTSVIKHDIIVEAENMGQACNKATNHIRNIPLRHQLSSFDMNFSQLKAEKMAAEDSPPPSTYDPPNTHQGKKVIR